MGFMTDQLNKKHKPEAQFGTVQALVSLDSRVNPHIESKIEMWMKQYHMLQEALQLSGFGWDENGKMIRVDSDDVR